MSGTDQAKVVDAGFMIIRRQDHQSQELKIKYKGNGGHEWKTLEKNFKNKSALEKRMKELLLNPMTVED